MASSVRRPEHKAPPDLFYNEVEARKYTQNTRMMEIQQKMSERALELLNLPDSSPSLLLDLGCGSGLSGECIEDNGHMWIGLDISQHMLNVAQEREMEGDLLLGDLGDGLPFRAGVFDGAISISALQWLCNADKWHVPKRRIFRFMSSLYACLRRGARAVFQFYPENGDQVEMIVGQSMRAGFTGGLVVDYPNSTKAKKFFLVLMTAGDALPKALGTDGNREEEDNQVKNVRKREAGRRVGLKSRRDWVLEKKERRRRKGLEVRADTKFTGRKRNRLGL